ncbi:replication initiator [Streptomyces prunicolor]|uniref:replication initiator n=1 Tax=Streptomyces prunicolor TaxID=67348 RepID=UPI002B1CFB5C|nr:replication initiator [Streptomyces prunicolor]
MLGYRGHILSKSRVYSTIYAALRAERAHHVGHIEIPDAITDRHWRYVGSGRTPGAALIAAGIADDIAMNREVAREEREASR